MRRKTGVFCRATAWSMSAMLALILAPLPASAQEGNVSWLDDGDVRRASIQDLQAKSQFRLFGEGDRAFSGLRPTGNMEFFVTNTGIVDAADGNWDSQPDISGCANCGGGVIGQWFDVSPIYAASRTDWERFIQDVPSLLNAAGQGYAVAHNRPTLGVREINASDLQFGTLFSGVTTTLDGGCQDFSGPNPSGNQAAAGVTLLAISNCPPTWPDVGGTPTFLGANVITADAFLNSQAAMGTDFNFEWWRVDPADIDPNQFFGNIQTYGAYDDYNSAVVGRFGGVVPGGSGPPEEGGWPMGIRTEFNAFTFALPTVANTMYWRSLIINRTEDVYGVGLDYENLYIGYSMGPIRGQESSFYMEVWRGAILTAESGTSDPLCPGAGVPGVGNLPANDCVNDAGFASGSGGLIVLKSPLGDLRNVLLSCNTAEAGVRQATRAIPCTTDDFFDPGNPHAGDTITYNHFRMCDFGGCTNQLISVAENQWFGGISSNTELTLNGRDPGSLPARDLYNTFKNPNFPDTPVPYAYWVPGTWDYTANGPTPGGDTLFVPTCWGPPGTGREARTDACVVTWSDTMPNDPSTSNPAYHNQEGNIAFSSLGPFQLAAGDTAAYVIAEVAGIDSARIEAEVNNAISLYMNFFLAPTPPPATTVVGSDATVVDPATGANPQLTIFLNDAAEEWVDPFLVDFANTKLAAGATPTLARVNALNPGLVDQILARAADNVQELLVFKSCDGGGTFTASDADGRGDLDCDGDPAIGTGGSTVDVGWQAYATLQPDANGLFQNQFVDQLIVPGQTYLYAILGRTRGAQFAIIDSVDTDGDGSFDAVAPDSLFIAPSILNPLATSVTEPNVSSIYIPTSIQSGGRVATASLTSTGPGDSLLVSQGLTAGFAGSIVVDDTYRLVFGNDLELDTISTNPDTFRVTVRDVVTADVGGVATDVAISSAQFTTANPAGVTANLQGNDLGFVLVRSTNDEPLLVSDVLDGANTTPSSFLARQAAGAFTGFPGFVVSVDNSNPGAFAQQFYGRTLQDAIRAAGALPTLVWNDDVSTNTDLAFSPFGKYEITFSGPLFGPGAPFTLNQAVPDETQADFEASLAARAGVTTTRTDATAAALLGVDESDLVAARVPFSVRNVTYDRDVSLVAIRNAETTMQLGTPATGDTLTVTVPANEWIPSDQLAFIETVTFDSATSVGLVLDANDDPVQATREALTFSSTQLDCGQNPRLECNPVTGPGSTAEISTFQGQVLSVEYNIPFDIDTRLVFDVQSARTGQGILDADADIRPQLDSIKAVPNPYVMFSRYELDTPQDDDARLMFTHLPPQGVLRIFTVSGQFVQELTWGPDDLAGNGDLFWNMRTREGNEAAGGLYVFVVTARNPATGGEEKKIGKFVIIR